MFGLCVSLSHIEDLWDLCVVEEVLLLVVFLELCCVVVPALLRCVCAGMGMLLGLQSEMTGGREREGREHERIQEEVEMKRCKTKMPSGRNAGTDAGRKRKGGMGDTRRQKQPRRETDKDSSRIFSLKISAKLKKKSVL